VLDTSHFFADPVASAESGCGRQKGGVVLERTDLILDGRPVTRERSDRREFVTRRIADETIIVPVVGGVGDLDAIFTLNDVGSHIWRLVDTPTTVHAIVEEIVRAFDVSRDQAEQDVVEFLDKLAEAGLIRPLTTPPGPEARDSR
jgi:Coenzyme PQQ synthesis protein D (PqqD)